MDNFESYKYTVDEIIDNIVKLQDMDSGEIVYESRFELPYNIHDGSIVLYDTEGYHMGEEEIVLEEEVKESVRDRIERLKALKNKKDE